MLAGPASAAELRLEMANGLVTIVATDVPLRQILAEWTKVGGTRIVNAERVAGPPVTLQLEQIPEQQALAILLRPVAGYLAAPRRAGGAGASQYESVMILATSTPPATAPPAAAARGQLNPAVRTLPPQLEMLEQQLMTQDDGGQVPSDGFITVGNAPAPRQQTPAAGAATCTKSDGARPDGLTVLHGFPDAAADAAGWNPSTQWNAAAPADDPAGRCLPEDGPER